MRCIGHEVEAGGQAARIAIVRNDIEDGLVQIFHADRWGRRFQGRGQGSHFANDGHQGGNGFKIAFVFRAFAVLYLPQRRAQGTGQHLRAFGIAADPEKVLGGAAGQDRLTLQDAVVRFGLQPQAGVLLGL